MKRAYELAMKPEKPKREGQLGSGLTKFWKDEIAKLPLEDANHVSIAIVAQVLLLLCCQAFRLYQCLPHAHGFEHPWF